MFQPSYLPEIQIWLVSGYSRLIESRKKNNSLQYELTNRRCEILGKWTTVVTSKIWAGFATNRWTHCPRQAWPRGSLIIKHYRVQEGNHQRGYRSPCISLALKKKLLLLEQINQWLDVLGDTYGMRMISLSDHRILRTCMTDLGWFQRTKTNFLEFTAATYIKCTWVKGSHYLHPNICFINETRRNAYTSFHH